jgi:hypothetical protein
LIRYESVASDQHGITRFGSTPQTMHAALAQNATFLTRQYCEHTGCVADERVVADAFAVSVALDVMLRQVLDNFEEDLEKLKSAIQFLREVKTHPFDAEWQLACMQRP